MNPVEQKVLALIDEKEVVEFLQGLIRCRSTYPPGDTRDAAAYCEDKLKSAGLHTVFVYPDEHVKSIWDDQVDHRKIPSVIGTLHGKKERPVLLFNAHIDTVYVDDADKWLHDPFGGVLDNGFIYGRGAGDDKGSVAAQVMAAVALARSGLKLNGSLVVNPVSDEEACSYRGTKFLRDAGYLNPDYVIIGEQTDNRVAVAERAVLWLEITFKGKAAHGAMPWEGNNAIQHAAQFVERIERELTPRLQARTHPLLPHATITVSKIEGGVNYNAVPDSCKVYLDRRMVPGETVQFAVKEIEDLLQQQRESADFEWKLKVIYDSGTPVNTDPNTQLIQIMLAASEQITGRKHEVVGYRQGSDGRLFAERNIPIAVYGPSDPAVGHAVNERVSVKQLVEATKVYALTAMRVLG